MAFAPACRALMALLGVLAARVLLFGACLFAMQLSLRLIGRSPAWAC